MLRFIDVLVLACPFDDLKSYSTVFTLGLTNGGLPSEEPEPQLAIL